MKRKLNEEDISPLKLSMILILVSAIFPLIITFMSPSVAESTNPNLGECNVSYKGIYIPCITLGEALRLNYYIIGGASALFYIGYLIYFHWRKNANKRN